MWNHEPRDRKTQIFKVLHFKPNFRGRLYMYSMGMKWTNLINKNPQSYLFMTQMDFFLFLRFWVQSIQALPNLVICFPNSGILFLITPNMNRKDNKIIYNPRNHIFSLILYVPIDSSPWLSKKNKVF